MILQRSTFIYDLPASTNPSELPEMMDKSLLRFIPPQLCLLTFLSFHLVGGGGLDPTRSEKAAIK